MGLLGLWRQRKQESSFWKVTRIFCGEGCKALLLLLHREVIYRLLSLMRPGLLHIRKGFYAGLLKEDLISEGLITGIKRERFEISHSSADTNTFCFYWYLLRFSKTREFWSSKAAFTITFFAAVSHNYDHKQRSDKPWNAETHKTDRYPPITNHKPWSFKPLEVNFCFLRAPLRWLTAAKNPKVSWLLNFRIRVFMKASKRHNRTHFYSS